MADDLNKDLLVSDEIEIIELDERLDLSADPLLWLSAADNNTVSGCCGCTCSCP
jgi:hypothetical protein